MFTCDYPNCGAQYTSEFAAVECAEQDAADDKNTREWFSKYDPHRKD